MPCAFTSGCFVYIVVPLYVYNFMGMLSLQRLGREEEHVRILTFGGSIGGPVA